MNIARSNLRIKRPPCIKRVRIVSAVTTIWRSYCTRLPLTVVRWRSRSDGMYIFFFQAEDGIRDGTVTGVQTCALPISSCLGCHKTHVGRAANDSLVIAIQPSTQPSTPASGGGAAGGGVQRPGKDVT